MNRTKLILKLWSVGGNKNYPTNIIRDRKYIPEVDRLLKRISSAAHVLCAAKMPKYDTFLYSSIADEARAKNGL